MRSHFLVAVSLVIAGPVSPWASDVDWTAKVDPWVLEANKAAQVEFLVFLERQANLDLARAEKSKSAKGHAVYEALTTTARLSQPPILALLEKRGVEYRPYWVANMIWVRGGLDTVRAMAERPDVGHIFANPTVRLDRPPFGANDGDASAAKSKAVEWNIARVNADAVWAGGVTGSGAVVAGQDTGYLWTHPALVNQYRGTATGGHDYNWHDAIHSGGGVCGADSPEPCDDYGHGTHTMGTAVGSDGGDNQVGVAPTASWIGCRNMNVGNGTPATYSECFEFFLAPTDLDGLNADPSKAPDVINNSWNCPASEGCTDPTMLLTVVQNVRAAGIVTVHSAGNSGWNCSTVSVQAGTYQEAFTVGATNGIDAIALFSSRGPVTLGEDTWRKPDVTGPGVGIRSTTFDGGYALKDGTSMAAPHVAGLVALLISTNPGLAGRVDEIEALIEGSALPLTTTQGCGGDGPDDVPNNVYGWGRIDALAAHLAALEIFSDGFESGNSSSWSITVP